MSVLILDASVFNKLFLDEAEKSQAVSLIKQASLVGFSLRAPTLIELEICKSALHYEVPFRHALDLLGSLKQSGLRLDQPSHTLWEKAERMCKTHEKGQGFPTLIDSLYHCLAIDLKGIFVTADMKHIRKANHFGHICALQDWETLFD